MTSPSSSILAKVKLRPLEKRISTDNVLIPTEWYRYVDDIFIVYLISLHFSTE